MSLTFGWVDRSLAFGFLPGLPAALVGAVVLLVVTFVTPAPRNKATEEYFALFDR